MTSGGRGSGVMQRVVRSTADGIGHQVRDRPDLIARLRAYGMVALLVPLFVGLSFASELGIPRIELQFVPREVPFEVPIRVPVVVERIVERLVYVAVPSARADAGTSPDTAVLATTLGDDNTAVAGSGPASLAARPSDASTT